VEEGYSLRHVVVEALLSFNNKEAGHSELNEVVEQLQDLILSLDKLPPPSSLDAMLPNSFLEAVRQSARGGVEAR
jgi:hypothetical protein